MFLHKELFVPTPGEALSVMSREEFLEPVRTIVHVTDLSVNTLLRMKRLIQEEEAHSGKRDVYARRRFNALLGKAHAKSDGGHLLYMQDDR